MRRHADGVAHARHQGGDPSDRRSANGRPRVDVIPLEAPESVLARLSTELTVRIAEPPSVRSDAGCILAVALTLSRPDSRARLQELRRQRPTTPLVIITSGDRANLVWLVGLNADAVVTVDRISVELGSVIRSLQRRSPLELAAIAFEEAESLNPVVRAAVLTAIQSVPPIRTVKALARRIGVSRKRLWDAFRPVQLRTGWSCLDLLHAVALWRAVELAQGSAGAVQRAWQELGLSDSTARRLCRAHLACPPSMLLDRAADLERAFLDFVERCHTQGGKGTS